MMRLIHHNHIEGCGRVFGRCHPNDAAVLQRAGPRHVFERGTHASILGGRLVQDEEPLQQCLVLLWLDTSAQPTHHRVGQGRAPCNEKDGRGRVRPPQQFEHLKQGDEGLTGTSRRHYVDSALAVLSELLALLKHFALVRREVLQRQNVLLVMLHVPSSVELDLHCSTYWACTGLELLQLYLQSSLELPSQTGLKCNGTATQGLLVALRAERDHPLIQ
eukprot:scaffold53217_cov71-Phaeocystis_antarctica.AAC.9